jgi:hypothetical protein
VRFSFLKNLQKNNFISSKTGNQLKSNQTKIVKTERFLILGWYYWITPGGGSRARGRHTPAENKHGF